MEELIYWGAIFLFYLFSAYRSKQKKQSSEEVFAPKPLTNQEKKSPNPDFNIFEFLNDSMEKSAIDIDELPKTSKPLKNTSQVFDIHSDLNAINESQPKAEYNIKDNHLTHLEKRIDLGKSKKRKSPAKKLLTIQKRLKNKPTKLAIVMQAIFDPPKSQGI